MITIPVLVLMSLVCRADFNEDGIVNGLDTGYFVQAFGQGCVTEPTLSWDNPTRNTDGSPLTDLSHVMVYWSPGNTSGLNVGLVNSFAVPGLDNNLTYQLWVTAVNTAGKASVDSGSVFWP